VLEVAPGASPAELHDAYRRLVKLHHPDRNHGSAESTRRFTEIQEAYDRLRDRPPVARASGPDLDDRMSRLETELREAHAARERARRAAREAAAAATPAPAPDSGEDSFSRIFADVRHELADQVSEARGHPAVRRVSELLDGLEDLASRLDRQS
jgi:curved DNA-binding protein CbpA